jgi:hypothetical protein
MPGCRGLHPDLARPSAQPRFGADAGHHCHYPVGQHSGYRGIVWALYFVIALVALMIICLALAFRSSWPSREASERAEADPEYAARRYWEGIARKYPRRAQARFWAAFWETEIGRPLDSKPRRRTGRRHNPGFGRERGRRYHYY